MKELLKKICICGDSGVGKTSLIRRFVTGKFDEKYLSTLGAVITKKSVITTDKEHNVRMMIWDISGQAEYKRIHKAGFSNTAGGLAVYDMTRSETADNLDLWITNFRKYAGADIPIVIIANKFDLIDAKATNTPSINDILKKYNLPILITSAKTGHNVEFAFQTLGDGLVKHKTGDRKLYDEMIEMPEVFENPSELLDYISIKFCEAVGDTEMGMHMLRKQVSDQHIEFTNITKDETMFMIDRLVNVVLGLNGVPAAKEFKKDLIKAHSRCKK